MIDLFSMVDFHFNNKKYSSVTNLIVSVEKEIFCWHNFVTHCDMESVLLAQYFLFILPLHQVQIEEQQGQAVGQVLQVAPSSQQNLQGISAAQLVQQGELTEEQQQQVQDLL